MSKFSLIISVLVILILTLLFPLWFKENVLVFYGAVVGGAATILAAIISITHDGFLAREKRIPYLQTKMIKMDIDEFKEQRHNLLYEYITESDNSEEILEKEMQCSEWIKTGVEYNNAFYIVELYNTNKEFSVQGLSISVEGKIIVKDVFIKADGSFKYIIGYHTGIFNNTENKSKNICVTYKYKSIDLDKTYEQKSDMELFRTSEEYPEIKFLGPPISKRKIAKK